MSVVTNKINKQRRVYFTYIWRGLALMAIGIYAGIMILINGMGTAVETGGKANILVRKLMAFLNEQGLDADKLLPIIMVGLFFVIAAIGLYHLVRGIWRMAPTHTALGKSILTQQKSSERFHDVVEAINADMGQEPQVFGSVHIGRKWILADEAMRIADIRGVFWFDQSMEDNVLCCVDEAQNIWAASLLYSDDRDKAAQHLKKMLPDAAFGDKDAYMAYLGGEVSDAVESESAASSAIPISLASDVTFSFVSGDGIPTSNFTYETVCQALHDLKDSQSIGFKVLTPRAGTVSEIFFTPGDNGWDVGVICGQDDEERRVVKTLDTNQTERILDSLVNEKCLPADSCLFS